MMSIVFAVGISIPDSMIVVLTRMSTCRLMNASMTFSSSRGDICPCPTITFAFGTIVRISLATCSMLWTRLWTK